MEESSVKVALPLPVDRVFSYRCESGKSDVGKRVLVPFGRRRIVGVISDVGGEYQGELRSVLSVLDEEPVMSTELMNFLKWLASYYIAPLGEVLRCALPKQLFAIPGASGAPLPANVLPGVRVERLYRLSGEHHAVRGERMKQVVDLLMKEGEISATQITARIGNVHKTLDRLIRKGLLTVTDRERYRDPLAQIPMTPESPRELNPDQHRAVREISAALDARRYQPFLLHGVTGSGKTEVYLQAIAHARSCGRGSLVLVPEISLTPLLVRRFRDRFGSGIAVLHSSLGDGERFDEWRRIRRREADIVIGARSALFAPLDDIGIIVVDEEHDAGYKQSEGVRYNARDMALVRGKLSGSVVVLGSATPLITSRYAAETGKMTLLELPRRAVASGMPLVEVVSMEGRRGVLSDELKRGIEEQLKSGEQTLLFLNRRGFAPHLVCASCRRVISCPNCSVSLTYHRSRERALCHYCDHSIPFPTICPTCGGGEFLLHGKGTERIEDEILRHFPQARIARLDRDTTMKRGSHQRILSQVAEREIDVLIGTQMVTKGHDFPGVTLVGVISADDSLNIPDLWSSERTFQLLTQVLGRSGRGEKGGRVIIQTMRSGHYALTAALEHDYVRFYREELKFRQDAEYPPFSRLVVLDFASTNENSLINAADSAARVLRELKREHGITVRILGPAVPPLSIVRGRHRRHILLKSDSVHRMKKLLHEAVRRVEIPGSVRMSIDIDPVDML